MIRAERESKVSCADCGEEAIRREFQVYDRYVSYDTHLTDLSDIKHHQAINRMKNFHTRARAFIGKLPKNLELQIGRVREFGYESVRPSACKPRELIRITATVQAFGFYEEVKTEARSLKGLRVASVIKQIRPLAEEAASRLKRKSEEGRF